MFLHEGNLLGVLLHLRYSEYRFKKMLILFFFFFPIFSTVEEVLQYF